MANLSFQTGLSHCHLGVGPKRISLGAGSHRAGRQFQVIGSENVRARLELQGMAEAVAHDGISSEKPQLSSKNFS